MNTESQVLNVPIEDIIPNRFQPRLNFDENSLKELSDSIKEHGIIQPLVLRRIGDKYEIIAGERRYKASKMAGLTSVPAIISTLDDKKSAEVAIVENIQRKDLSSIEEAKSYKALLDKGYLTQDELAKKMGLSQSAISNKLRLLSLSPMVQDALMKGKISERHARSLLQISSLEEQDKWLKSIIDERLTVRELDNRLKSIVDSDNNSNEIISDIDKIKENAKDIVGVPKYEDIITPTNPIAPPKEMPNKFFNFLEDEAVNMNTMETPIKEEPPEEQAMEEIEMLDFTPTNNSKVFENANYLVNKLVEDLNNSSYKVDITKDENTNELKYTIIINKEEDKF